MQTCGGCAGDGDVDGAECKRCQGRGWLHDLEALRFEHAEEMKAIDEGLEALEAIKDNGH